MRCYYCYYLLFFFVRECVTLVENLNPLDNDAVDDNSLLDSFDNNISSLNLDGSDDKLLFNDLNDSDSNLAVTDDDISALNLGGGDKLLFGDPNGAGPDLAADDSLFNLNSQDAFDPDLLASDNPGSIIGDGVNPLLTADANANKLSNCNSNNNPQQPLSRKRARSTTGDDFCPEIKAKLPPTPREGYLTPLPNLETDEELKRFFCPTQLFQGILNIPVCALYDDFLLFGSDVFSLEIMAPLSNTRLTNVMLGKLSRWCFSHFPPFFPRFFLWKKLLISFINVSKKETLLRECVQNIIEKLFNGIAFLMSFFFQKSEKG